MRTMNAERTAGVLIGLVAFAVAAASASTPKDSGKKEVLRAHSPFFLL